MKISAISKREKEVLNLIAHEYTSKQIARELFISPYTADSHRKNLISKMGVKNTAGLVRVGFQRGLLLFACSIVICSLQLHGQGDIEIEGKIEIEKGTGNVIIGKDAANSITSGNNSIIGHEAARDIISAGSNVVIGRWAGLTMQYSGENVYVGNQAGKFNNAGFGNVMVGRGAGMSSEGYHNVIIGADSDPSDPDVNHSISIGYNVEVACSNCAMIGPAGDEAVNVGIGISAPETPLHIKQKSESGIKGMRMTDSEDSETWDLSTVLDNLSFSRNGVVKAFISPTDGMYTASDFRLKKNIDNLKNGLEIILKLEPKEYQYKDVQNGKRSIGFIAQDVKDIIPELVSSNGEYLGVNYDGLAALAIQAIKEQQELINSLQSQINDLAKIRSDKSQ